MDRRYTIWGFILIIQLVQVSAADASCPSLFEKLNLSIKQAFGPKPARISGGKAFPQRPMSPPRVNALQDYTAKTGIPLKIVSESGGLVDAIADARDNKALFFFRYKIATLPAPPHELFFNKLDASVAGTKTGYREDIKGQGFYSLMLHRMVERHPEVRMIKASLEYDNLARINELVKQGYSVAEAIKGTASYRVYAQNGFTEIDISSISFTEKEPGMLSGLSYFVRKP